MKIVTQNIWKLFPFRDQVMQCLTNIQTDREHKTICACLNRICCRICFFNFAIKPAAWLLFLKIIYICRLGDIRMIGMQWAWSLHSEENSHHLSWFRQMEKGNYGVKWWVTISFGNCICCPSQSPWIHCKKPGLSISLGPAAVVRTALQWWTSRVGCFWLALRNGAGSCQRASPATCGHVSWCTRQISSCQMSACIWKQSSCHLPYC